ncbi:MAG: NTP transferase domain-containing protein [Planctomycetes bacterium]|nr:NTP transferase domain-containing protein [Planctomycetota bacterium]
MAEGKTVNLPTHALVLAAGKGKRMGSDIPKVMIEAGGRPLIDWVLANLTEAGISTITVVIGFGKETVIKALPAGVNWVEQKEQLGTAHAVLCAKPALRDINASLLITYGDMPLVTATTFRTLLDAHTAVDAACTVLTATIDKPTGYGRIVRDEDGLVQKIVEAADASSEELAITEVNTGVYVFNPGELFAVLSKISNNNRQGEYYLTDAVELLLNDGKPVAALLCKDSEEGCGVNSKEDLKRVEEVLLSRA